MATVNFNNIIGPPCSSVLNSVINDPELAAKESDRQSRIQKALNALGPPPEEWQFIRPGSGSMQVLGELTGTKMVGNCPISIYELPPRLDGRLGFRLWSFHQAYNKRVTEVAGIRCIEYPPQSKKAISKFEFVANIYNKITTTTNYEFFISPDGNENNMIPVPATNFINSGGKTKYFSCNITDPWFSPQPTINEEIKPINFNLLADIEYTIDYPEGSSYILTDSKISITKQYYDDERESKKIYSFDENKDPDFTNNYIDGVYVPTTTAFGNIPNKISSIFKKWIKYNTFKDAKTLSYNTKKYDKKSLDCEDDCGREITIWIHKRFLTQTTIQTVSCPTCSPPLVPKYTYYIKKHNGSFQPKLTECKLV